MYLFLVSLSLTKAINVDHHPLELTPILLQYILHHCPSVQLKNYNHPIPTTFSMANAPSGQILYGELPLSDVFLISRFGNSHRFQKWLKFIVLSLCNNNFCRVQAELIWRTNKRLFETDWSLHTFSLPDKNMSLHQLKDHKKKQAENHHDFCSKEIKIHPLSSQPFKLHRGHMRSMMTPQNFQTQITNFFQAKLFIKQSKNVNSFWLGYHCCCKKR